MLLGILILVIGIFMLLNTILVDLNLGFIFYLAISMFTVGIYKIVKEQKISGINLTITIIGLIISLVSLGILPVKIINTIIPIIIIIIGVIIVYNTSQFKRIYSKNTEIKKYYSLFSEGKNKITNLENSDIDSYAIFGSSKLDLSELEIKNNISLNVYSIFGENTIIVSDKYKISTTSTTFFGENNKNIMHSDKKHKYKITINCISIFGGIKVIDNDKINSK